MSEKAQTEQKEQNVQPEAVEQEAVETAAEQSEAVEAAGIEDHTASLISDLEKQLSEAQAKVSEQQDEVLRTRAEMENVRRRAAQDVEKAHKFALEKFTGELLPVLDSMELALSHADHGNETLKPVLEGVELTLKTLQSAVGKFGVEIVDPVGQTFDPNKHQAITMIENPEAAPNSVVAVMQKGYELNGRLLRPAMVVVAKAPSAPIDTTA